jgi:hypothetical protein
MCKYVKHLWQELNLERVRARLADLQSAKDMLLAIWELEEKERLLVVNLLWHWWLERNRITEGERRRDPAGLAPIIRFQAEESLKLSATENTKLPAAEEVVETSWLGLGIFSTKTPNRTELSVVQFFRFGISLRFYEIRCSMSGSVLSMHRTEHPNNRKYQSAQRRRGQS